MEWCDKQFINHMKDVIIFSTIGILCVQNLNIKYRGYYLKGGEEEKKEIKSSFMRVASKEKTRPRVITPNSTDCHVTK